MNILGENLSESALIDNFGRRLEYLRLSVTDKCNLRCAYCMPPEGVPNLSHQEVLSFEEILRLLGIMKAMGLKKVKLTGGEPLLRRGIVDLARRINDIGLTATLTTNGMLLPKMAQDLYEAGVSAVNISLDTLNRERYLQLTGFDALETVLEGLETALSLPWVVKINCVPIRDVNFEDLVPLAAMAKEKRVDVRFIELMPMGYGAKHKNVPTKELMALFDDVFGRMEEAPGHGNGPAEYFRPPGFIGRLGFISAISHKFCDNCNRLRLSCDGHLRLCLNYDDSIFLKPLLRGGQTDSDIEEVIRNGVMLKPRSHGFLEGNDGGSMSRIGG